MDIIGDYGKASWQEVNLEKLSIMFGKKVPPEVRTQIKAVMGISNEGGMGSYLGIPKNLQGSKTKVFRYINDRLDDRVNGWSTKFYRRLPMELTHLTNAISKFWWKSNDKARVCTESLGIGCEGNLGFRALEQFNDAMLAKQYFQKKHPLQAKKPYSPSFAWRSIFSTKSLVEHGSRWAIGSGCNVSVWRDPWIPDIQPRPANGRGRQLHPNLMVNHLINPSTKEWHMPILEEFLDPADIQIILSMEISKSFKPDKLIWHYTKSGKYSVKSGYRLARDLIREVEYGPTCTPLRAPPKIQQFFWQIASGSLPVLERLAHQGVRCDPLYLCIDGFPFGSLYSNLDFLLRASSQSAVSDISSRLPWIVWSIWKDRNKKVYQGIETEPDDVLIQVAIDKASDPLEGLGWWFCNSEDVTLLLGARSQRRGPSPLHSELQALVWAMASILACGVDCQIFEMDCGELLAMVQSPDNWPVFSNLLDEFSLLRSSFPSFMLSRIIFGLTVLLALRDR
ncbi:PREDICTED: uncharacterized protein LOC104772442 [Camelina sativa]|uniref:Uncharacterized protein LOC104772442 n=1 Tax=Camelina sativa TaxID=90675 RepID=A0ABM0Y4J6_CAMSA|nr:PREDICTED: uncharacterized protein LOC104772442 [Camelina sativa]